MVGDRGGERGVQLRELRGGCAEIDGEVPQVVEETQRTRRIIIALGARQAVRHHVAMRRNDGREGLRQCIQFRAVHQHDGAGAAGAGLIIIIIEILPAVGQQVGLAAAEHVPGQGLVDHPVGEDLRRRCDDIIADIPDFPGHLDRTHQAGVEDEVIQVHRDGVHEIGELHPADVIRIALELVADGLGGGPGGLAGRGTETYAGSLAVAVVTCRYPTSSVGGEQHPVGARREEFLDVLQRLVERLLGRAQGHVDIGLEGVGDGPAAGAAQDADQLRRVGRRIIAGGRRVVAECQNGPVARDAGEDALLHVLEILQQVAAEVVVSQPDIDQHLLVRPLVRTVKAVAGRQDDGRQGKEECFDPAHNSTNIAFLRESFYLCFP